MNATIALTSARWPCCVPSFGQLEKTKETGTVKKEAVPAPADIPQAIPGEVDVHFFNGSTVRMIIHSEKLEIATLYGKLACRSRTCVPSSSACISRKGPPTRSPRPSRTWGAAIIRIARRRRRP